MKGGVSSQRHGVRLPSPGAEKQHSSPVYMMKYQGYRGEQRSSYGWTPPGHTLPSSHHSDCHSCDIRDVGWIKIKLPSLCPLPPPTAGNSVPIPHDSGIRTTQRGEGGVPDPLRHAGERHRGTDPEVWSWGSSELGGARLGGAGTPLGGAHLGGAGTPLAGATGCVLNGQH